MGFGNDYKGKFLGTQQAGTDILRGYVSAYIVSDNPLVEERLTKMFLNWKFYHGEHWSSNNDRLMSFNYCKAFVNKINSFFAGKNGFECNVESIYGEIVPEDVERHLESRVNYHWNKNKKGLVTQNILRTGSVSGVSYVFLSLAENKKYIKVHVLDSRKVYPMLDADRKLVGYRVIKTLSGRQDKYIQFVDEYTLNNHKTYYVKDTAANAEKFAVVNTPNTLGFIPIVPIYNTPEHDEYSGISDMEDIVKLNKTFNEVNEEVLAIIKYYSQPTTIITGARADNLVRGINQIWSGLPSDAQVFNLTLNSDLGLNMQYLAQLKTAMHELSNVPENTLGKIQPISNTSAAALTIAFQPLIQKADDKWLSYGSGIEEVNSMILKMDKMLIPSNTLPKFPVLTDELISEYTVTPVFKYGLPSDRMLMLQEADIELRTKVASRREVMERLGKKNIPKILGEIDEDTDKQVAFQAALTKSQETTQTTQTS